MDRDDFSEVYLFFGFDGHQNNLGADDDYGDVLEQMLVNFDNETEHGKLYISYPMVESLRDFEVGVCGNKKNCYVMTEEMEKYKYLSAEHSKYPQFKEYDFEIWKNVMDVFAMRLSCLMKQENTVTYKQYIEEMTPYEIFQLEKQGIQKSRVFVLSAFPEFLLDYFGMRLWKKCVKSTKNLFCNNFNIEMS